MTRPKWDPDKKQWRVIWTVYGIAFLTAVNWGPYDDTPMDTGPFLTLVVIAGVLVLWRMEQRKRGG